PARPQRRRARVRPGDHLVEAAALRDEPGRGGGRDDRRTGGSDPALRRGGHAGTGRRGRPDRRRGAVRRMGAGRRGGRRGGGGGRRGGGDAHRSPAGRAGRSGAPARCRHPGNWVTLVSGGSGPGRSLPDRTDLPPLPGSLAVTGGTVVTTGGPLRADVVIEDGRIAALARPGPAPAGPDGLDATGCLVLPGGVDPHCHIMADVTAASPADARGGTTTVLSFTNPGPGEGAAECVLRRREELIGGRPAVDVGLHAMLYRPDEVADLAALRDAGVYGIKVFLAYSELGIMWSTRGLFELMTAAARHGQVVQVHCEEGELIDGLTAAAVAAGRAGVRVFAEPRPPGTEAAAVARVLETARLTGATCYLVHLSCAEALDQVRLARRRGSPP